MLLVTALVFAALSAASAWLSHFAFVMVSTLVVGSALGCLVVNLWPHADGEICVGRVNKSATEDGDRESHEVVLSDGSMANVIGLFYAPNWAVTRQVYLIRHPWFGFLIPLGPMLFINFVCSDKRRAELLSLHHKRPRP
jgi:hypothetical protein